MNTLPQCTMLAAKGDIKFAGRRFKIRKGQQFWVTSTKISQNATGTANIARKGSPMGDSVNISLSDLHSHFEVIG